MKSETDHLDQAIKQSKKKSRLNKNTFAAQGPEMAEIIKNNGDLLRAGCPVNPYRDPETATAFYSGVAMGIGIALKWRDKK